MRAIVHDFGVTVNEYAQLGRHEIPHYKPATCPACDRPGTLVSHGLRRRVAWVSTVALLLLVRRLRCSARGGCGCSFTVLPSFLQPRRRYVVEELQKSVEARFVEGLSFDKMDRQLPSPPVASTRRGWVRGFATAAGGWLSALGQWFAEWNPAEAVLARAAEVGGAVGLIALAIHSLDWMRSRRGLPPVEQSRWLEELLLWGAVRGPEPLFPPESRAGPSRGP